MQLFFDYQSITKYQFCMKVYRIERFQIDFRFEIDFKSLISNLHSAFITIGSNAPSPDYTDLLLLFSHQDILKIIVQQEIHFQEGLIIY